MSRCRHALPQLGKRLFITEGGLETTLLFHHGLELPEFAAYHVLRDEAGYKRLYDYYVPFLELARQHNLQPGKPPKRPGSALNSHQPLSSTEGQQPEFC